MKGGPELRFSSRSELEVDGQHTDDGVRNAAESDGLSDYVLSSAKPVLPSGVTKDHSPGGCRQILTSVEVTAQHRSDTQGVKESITHARTGHRFGACGSTQQIASSSVDVHRTENLVKSLPVEVVRIRKVGARNHGNAFRHVHQSIGVGVRQRPDECG